MKDTGKLLDFLYLDMDFVNSLSAQLFKGNLLETFLNEVYGQTEKSSGTYGSSEVEKTSTSGGVGAGIAHGGIGQETGEHNYREKTLEEEKQENASETLKIATNEYAFNNVINELSNISAIKTISGANRYDFVELKNHFRFYDFTAHNDIFNYERMVELTMFFQHIGIIDFEKIETYLKQAKGLIGGNGKKSEVINDKDFAKKFIDRYNNTKIFKTIEKMSNYMSRVFGDHFILLSENNDLIICKNEHLKIPSISLTLSGEVEATVYGKVINDNTKNVENEDFSRTLENSNPEELISKGAEFFILNYLSHIYGLKSGKPYNLIQAIGIYFDR